MIRTITPIFSIIIGISIFFFFTQPMFAEIKQAQGETTQYTQAVKTAEARNEQLNEKQKEKRSHSPEDLERLDALVPQAIDEVKILADLSEIARKHTMLFGNVSITKSEDDGVDGAQGNSREVVGYESLAHTDIEFSLIGTYDQFKSLLADVESSLVMLEVQDINFSTGEGLFQQYTIAVRLYALPPAK
jgi:Tfp pilus assembly protein PilO